MPYSRYLTQLANASVRVWRECLWPLDYLNAGLKYQDDNDAVVGPSRPPIVLIPGFMSPDASMWPLRQHLHGMGFRCHDSLLGINTGDSELSMKTLTKTITNVVANHRQAVALIGVSFGGTLATRAALALPEAVAEVITIGAPLDRQAVSSAQRHTHIYSRGDGIVDWREAHDVDNPLANNVEVAGTHLGLAINPAVWAAVTQALTNAVTE